MSLVLNQDHVDVVRMADLVPVIEKFSAREKELAFETLKSILKSHRYNARLGLVSVHQEIWTFLRMLTELHTDLPIRGWRQFVFLEDHMAISMTPFIFKTNYPGTVAQLETLGRSQDLVFRFEDFQSRLEQAGYEVALVKKLNHQSRPPSGIPVVNGGPSDHRNRQNFRNTQQLY